MFAGFSRKKVPITVLIVGLIHFTILIAERASFAENRSASPLTTVKLAQFGQERFLLYLPLYVAMEEGLFAKQGLEIKLLFAGNDDQIFASVVSGAADFGVGDPAFTAIAAEKGFSAKTVALMITKLALSGYAKPSSVRQIVSPKDLEGLRISTFPAPSTTYTLLKRLVQETPLKDTTLIETAVGTPLALLRANRVDIAVDLEPAVSIAENLGYSVVLSLGNFSAKQAITGVMTSRETIKKRPKLVHGVVFGLTEALMMMHADPSIALKTAQKLFPKLPKKVVRAAVDRMLSQEMYPESAVVPDGLWQRTLKTRLESGELKSP